MKYIKPYLLFTFLLSGMVSQAQQLGQYNLYNQNLYLINPAAVGLNNGFTGYINHRKQWANIENSPTNSGVTIDSRVGRGHGFGGNLQFANFEMLSQFSGKLSYAFHLQTGKKSYLHSGISFGINHQNIDLSGVIATDYTDRLLNGDIPTGWGVSNDLGLMFNMPRLRLGVTLLETFNTDKSFITGTGEKFNTYAAYDLIDNEQWRLESSVLYRYSSEQEDQVDVLTRLMWKNTIGVGAMYRTNYGAAFMAEIHFQNKFTLAYSYDYGVNKDDAARGGSHGVLLGIRMLKKKRSVRVPEVEALHNVPDPEPVREPVEEEISIQKEVTIPVEEEPKKEVTTPAPDKKEYLEQINDEFAQSELMIRFEHASGTEVLSGNQEKVLNKAVNILKEHPDVNVVVIGHASSVGDIGVNQDISEKRAALIAQALMDKGIASSRITHLGKGELEPIADNRTADGAEQNRRVQLIFK